MSRNMNEQDVQKVAEIARIIAPRIIQLAQAVSNAVRLLNADIDIADETRDIEVMIIDRITFLMESDKF